MKAPFATWIGPTPNQTVGGMVRPLMGLVLHIQQGTEAGSEAWFKNPQSQASAHFLNPKSGPLRQLVDTDDKAWAQVAGNSKWVSVENEGLSGDSLTSSQLSNLAELVGWLHLVEGIPLQITDRVDTSGLGWHGMGGTQWGGHLNCPGDPIKNQRAAILQLVEQLSGSTPTSMEDHMIHLTDPINNELTVIDPVDGSTYGFDTSGRPRAFFYGDLRSHPDWHPEPIFSAKFTPGGNPVRSDLVFITRGPDGFRQYQFPGDGSLGHL